ncbi:citron Rho-interacting kinase [Hyalella azteca]|uniref:Citron Rho-interacting kinase n=1 Tax=Hyalella azteca TaxID=294128 RepID=A0A8B7NAK2_HYAAZ|nr:citron Rho-interacting kinase [Hyalella azteca]
MQQRIAELEEQLSVAHQAAASQLTQHQEAVQEAQAQVTLLQQKLASNEGVAADLTAATRQIEDIKVDKQEVERKLQEALQEASGLQRELQERDVQITKLQEGTALLKDLCSEQDEQLAQLDTLDERMQLQRQQREKLEEQVQSLQCEVKAAKAQVNEEKSLKVFQERQVKTLQAQLQQQEATHQQEQDALNKHCDEYAASNSKLLLRLSELEKELFSTEATVQALEESAEVQKEQLEALQQEAQGHIKHIQALKDTNFQLTQGLEEAIEKGQLYKRKMTELAGHLEEEREVMRDKELRTKMTTEQQTKLIDFLHAKLDDSNKKKSRTLSSKLFGGRDKENQSLTPYKSRSHLPTPDKCTLATTPHPNATPLQHSKLLKTSSTPPQSHKTPSTLLPQSSLKPPVAKTSSAQFATPMNEFKTPKVDLRTPKVDFKTPKVGTSNASVAAGAEGTPTTGRSRELASRQRIRHDIPHRFERSMIVQVGRCSGCLSSVPRGRFAYRCSHCGAVAHKHCTTGVPATCGLPQQLAQHFTHNTQTAKVLHEGWVKIPKASKACWEFCFTRLLSNGDLLVFDHEPSDAGDCSLAAPPSCNAPTSAAGVSELQPTSTISLCVPNCRLEVVSAVPRSEIPATSTVDLPYVFKVDVLRGYQQSIERLYLMTSNFEQKQRWVAALEHVAQQCGDSVSVTGDSNVRVLPLLQLPASSLTPNTLIFIHDDVCLLGCEEGLVSCSVEGSGELLKKARLGSLSAVQQLLDIPTAQRVAVIAGEDRSVYLLPHATLLGAARHCSADEPNVPHEAVAALSGVRCHLLATGVTTNGATFMCAAAEDRVSILVWDTSSSQLQVVRQYGTQEACTSCLFTPAALIVAADKLYEIDLTSFSIEEFLDESDTSLAYAVYGTARLSSYPLAILQVSESGKYGEFLICFNEFALFVDPYGQRSREHDIKFTRVPIAIEYCDGKLYLLHSNCIEVLRITSDSFTKVTSSQTGLDGPEFDSSSLGPSCLSASMALSQPHLIGKRAGGVVVRCEGEQGSLDVLQLTAEFPSAALSGSWSSLPSAITTASSDIADITSETSGSHSVGEKRKQDGKPAASSSARASAAPAKRSKQDLAH